MVITNITMIISCSITWHVPTSLSLHTLSIEVSTRVPSTKLGLSRVCARKTRAGKWKITSVNQPHTYASAEAEYTHLKLNSRFIARQLCPIVKHVPTITVSALVETIFQLYNYYVKYGKAWRAKQRALEIIFGNWEEAYERHR